MPPTHQSISHNLNKVEPFLRFLSALVALPEQMKRDIAAKVLITTLTKGQLIKTDDMRNHMVFLAKGAIRGFIMVGRQDVTISISLENNVLGSPNAEIFTRNEYPLTLQAVEECQLMMMPYSLIPYLQEKYPSMAVIGERLTGLYYYVATERSLLSRLPSAQLRYFRLLKTNPEFFKRIPLKYLASYLVMRNETLSRLRTKNRSAGIAEHAD